VARQIDIIGGSPLYYESQANRRLADGASTLSLTKCFRVQHLPEARGGESAVDAGDEPDVVAIRPRRSPVTNFDAGRATVSLLVVETRKAWRNRDASAGAGVLALLEALRHGLGAESVGLFDDDRADPDPDAGSARGALNFWDSFGDRPCAEIEWDAWYRALRAQKRVDTTCHCGRAHRLCGFLIHDRWALMLVVPAVLPAAGAAAIASSLRALAERLPPAMTSEERRQASFGSEDDPSPPATMAAAVPVWWVRKRLA
jgi:hypothetical protein